MEKELKELLIVLDILIANHKELVSCEQNKLQLIIAQDWENLGEQLKRSEKILESIATAEKLRVDLLKQLGFGENTPVKDFIKGYPEPQKKQLLDSAQELTRVVQNLKALNRQIATLLNTSLEVVNFSISLFQGHGADHKTYCMNGEEKKGQENNTSLVLDTRA
jgi:flagellar biosynthesis/type III secretory pathway chaperone